MPSKIHFVCRDHLGVRCIDPKEHTYESEAWLLSPGEAEALEGGRVLLHQTKAKPSYFGGEILSLRPVEDAEAEETGRKRHIITLRSTLDARGQPWDKAGKGFGMAWSSGVIPLPGEAKAKAAKAETTPEAEAAAEPAEAESETAEA